MVQLCRFRGCVREGRVFSFLRCVPPGLPGDDDLPYLLTFLSGRCVRRGCKEVTGGLKPSLDGAELLDPGLLRAFPQSPWGGGGGGEGGNSSQRSGWLRRRRRLPLLLFLRMCPRLSSRLCMLVGDLFLGVW